MRPLLVLFLLLGACGPDPARDALALGDSALQQLRLEAAIEHYTEAVRLDSTLTEAYLRRGQVHWMRSHPTRAIADLDRALALNPDLGWAAFFRGSSLVALNRFDDALPDLTAAAASDDLPPEDRARAHQIRAIVFMHGERYDAGTKAMSEALALQPEHTSYYYERGLLYAAMDRPADAIRDLQHFLRLDSTSSEVQTRARLMADSLKALSTP